MPTKLSQEIKTREELAKILKIDLAHLELVAKEKYKHSRKRKEIKNGKEREYTIADKVLKPIHQSIDVNILGKLIFPSEINGAIAGRSREQNALPHTQGSNVAHFDIKDFYPTTAPDKVYVSLRSIGVWSEPAKLLTSLTTTSYLPVGFVTSPKLSALILIKLNRRVKAFLKDYGIAHSLWIDDLTLSGAYPLKKLHSGIKSIIESEGYLLNKKKSDKTKIAYKNQSQKVTGINISNGDLSVDREKVLQVKRAIYICGKFGLENYIRDNEPNLSIEGFKMKMAGRIGNLLSVNKAKYKKIQDEWEVVLGSLNNRKSLIN